MFLKHKLVILLIVLFCNFILKSQSNITLLSELIKLPSLPGNEKQAAQFLENYCKEKKLHITTFTNGDSTYNFAASLLPLHSNKPNIVFLNHIDVVPANNDNNDWRHEPFSGKVINDTIWGRGALDMKGMAVMQLFALLNIKENYNLDSLPFNVSLLCLSGEESGGKNGAKLICDNYLSQLNPCVVLGEGGAGLTNVLPGNANQQVFFVSLAEKRSLWIKLEAKLKTHGHASMPTNKSANRLILKAINKVENNEPKIKFDHTTKIAFKQLGKLIPGFKGFLLGHIYWVIFKPIRYKALKQNDLLLPMVQNTFQLTKIYNTPGALNQIPNSASAYFDCRLLPRFGEKPFAIKRLMRTLDPRIKLSIIDESPEAEPTKPDVFFDKLKMALKKVYEGSETIPFLFLASSDNSYFRNKNIPTFGIMPIMVSEAQMQSVHAANERIAINQLNKGSEVYVTFLKTVFKK
jgi:carboxypeptidase PM20D1